MSEIGVYRDRVIDAAQRTAAALALGGLIGGSLASEPLDMSVFEVSVESTVVADHVPQIDSQGREILQLPTQIPRPVSQFMASDSIRFNPIGCSGLLVRDQDGRAKGAALAEHCNLRDQDMPRIIVDGKTYINSQNGLPITVRTGYRREALQEVGQVSEVLAYPKDDKAHDTALVAFDGSTAAEVLSHHRHLSPEAVRALPRGETIYLSGWPQQPEPLDFRGPEAATRHDFALKVLGVEDVRVNDKMVPVLIAAMRRDAKGAECSYGNSGGQGFLWRDGRAWSVGALSYFRDLAPSFFTAAKDAETNKRLYEERFGVNLSQADAVCGFAFYLPAPGKAEVLHIASNAPTDLRAPQQADREEHEERERFKASALRMRAQFFDDDTPRTILKGIVSTPMPKGSGYPDGLWVKDPALLYDEPTGNTFLAAFGTMPDDKLNLVLIENPDQIEVWANLDKSGDDEPVEFVQSRGAPKTESANDEVLNGFEDPDGTRFAASVSSRLAIHGAAHRLLIPEPGVYAVTRK